MSEPTDPAPPDPAPPPGPTPLSDRFFGWTRHPRAGVFVLIFLGVLTGVLMTLDFIVHRHHGFAIEDTKTFYAVYGFCAFAFVVLMGWPLGKLLRRPEDFYDLKKTRRR